MVAVPFGSSHCVALAAVASVVVGAAVELVPSGPAVVEVVVAGAAALVAIVNQNAISDSVMRLTVDRR
jgi:hypothetical protein